MNAPNLRDDGQGRVGSSILVNIRGKLYDDEKLAITGLCTNLVIDDR